jgi:IS5 family transposase
MSIRWWRQYSFEDWLFRKFIDRSHELVRLSERIDWPRIYEALSSYYSSKGRQAKDIRLMVGLHILKHRYNLSDEAVVTMLHENIYWMYFCGIFQPPKAEEPPHRYLESSSLTKFRKRLGPEGMERLEEIIKDQLKKAHLITPRVAITDTTAMEKAIAYPTDTDLLYKARERMVRVIKRIKRLGVEIPGGLRTFRRSAKRVLLYAKKLGQDKLERVERANRELSRMAQKVIEKVPRISRSIRHQIHRLSRLKKKEAKRLGLELSGLKELTQRIILQNAQRFSGRHVPSKVYSLDEPQVAAIKKGKQGKPTEYGTKVSLTVDRKGFVISHQEYSTNLADIHTLPDVSRGWQKTFGRVPSELGADRGFHHPRGSRKDLGTEAIGRLSIPYKGNRRHPESDSYWFKRLQRARARIEPIVSHLKSDHRMGRSRYRGFEGDQINVSLATLAWNCKKWMQTEMAT